MNTNGDSTNPDNDWRPPTEAEKKVLMAKRERSDKISKRMAEYLLKGMTYLTRRYSINDILCHLLIIITLFANLMLGYKMLATTCRVCDTIELQDKQDKIFCIACTEIDCHENLKDNPALSSSAANRTLAESNERRTNASTSFPESRPIIPLEGESQRVPGTNFEIIPDIKFGICYSLYTKMKYII